MPARRTHLGTLKEIRGQLALGQFHANGGRSGAIWIGRGLDPAKTVTQDPPQHINREPERLALRRQIEDQLFFVVSQIVLHGADFGILP